MTTLPTDYTEPGTEDLYLESLSDEEAAREMARQHTELLARIRAARTGGGKEFTPSLHPRDAEGRFAETAGGGTDSLKAPLEGMEVSYSSPTGSMYTYLEVHDPAGLAGDPNDSLIADVAYHADTFEGRKAVFIDMIRVDPSRQGKGVAVAMAADLHDHTDAVLLWGSFASKEGIQLGVYMASHHPEWNKLWLGGDSYWTPGDPIPSNASTFGLMDYGTEGGIQPAIAAGQLSAEALAKDFTERLHPRDEHGRFTDTGSLGDTAITQGGFSLSLAGDRPHSGWMVSRFGSERSFSIEQLAADQPMSFVPGEPWHDNFTHEVDRFVADHRDELKQKGTYLGGWIDSGRLFLDCSVNIPDRAEAERFAKEQQQFAIFNAGTGEYVSFEQERRAAARTADEKADQQIKNTEKVLLEVDPDEDDAETIAGRLHRALFG